MPTPDGRAGDADRSHDPRIRHGTAHRLSGAGRHENVHPQHGTVVASFNIESFSLERLSNLTRDELDKRYAEYVAMRTHESKLDGNARGFARAQVARRFTAPPGQRL